MSENLEAMSEILDSLGISATEDQIKEIVEGYGYHLQMMQEMYSNQFVGSSKKPCEKCTELKSKVEKLERDIEVYRNSVKSRRNASNVWIEYDSVMYDL